MGLLVDGFIGSKIHNPQSAIVNLVVDGFIGSKIRNPQS
jgi:hypothetical protein